MTKLFDHSHSAYLFDMDGTILTSIASAERVWRRWAERHGLDADAFLPTIHGVRSADTIRALGLPAVDPVEEAHRITLEEIEDVADVSPIAGAASFLDALPKDRWAIVTSAPRELALARLRAAGLSLPDIFLTAEDVVHGKPAPDGYCEAARRLRVRASDCLVFEDAPAGAAAGEATGADVLMITQTHRLPWEGLLTAVRDYTGLRVEKEGDRLWLHMAEGVPD